MDPMKETTIGASPDSAVAQPCLGQLGVCHRPVLWRGDAGDPELSWLLAGKFVESAIFPTPRSTLFPLGGINVECAVRGWVLSTLFPVRPRISGFAGTHTPL